MSGGLRPELVGLVGCKSFATCGQATLTGGLVYCRRARKMPRLLQPLITPWHLRCDWIKSRNTSVRLRDTVRFVDFCRQFMDSLVRAAHHLPVSFIYAISQLYHVQNTVSHHIAAVNPLNAELNPICHLLALLGTHHILHINRIRVKQRWAWLVLGWVTG